MHVNVTMAKIINVQNIQLRIISNLILIRMVRNTKGQIRNVELDGFTSAWSQ